MDDFFEKEGFVKLVRKRLINWLARQPVEIQCLVFDEQRNQFFKLKELGDKKTVPFLAFLKAIEVYRNKVKLLNNKNKSSDLANLANISKIDFLKMKKQKSKPKFEKLLNVKSVLESLHEQGHSLREIQSFLKSRHRLEVSHTYLGQFIKKYIRKDGDDVSN